MCHEISVGKTGCLTKSRMTVGKYQITLSEPHDHIKDGVYDNCFITRLEQIDEIKNLITESILSNSDVYLIDAEEDNVFTYEPRGQEIEVALMKFLIDNDKDVHSDIVNRNKNTPKLC